MLTIGDKFPDFSVRGTVANQLKDAFVNINQKSFAGKWLCVFFYPKNFSTVCPTEVSGFARLHDAFKTRDCQILGVSLDSEYAHLAWRREHRDLRELPFPLLADVKRELSLGLGIIERHTGFAMRATFLVDPTMSIRFVSVTDGQVGRNPEEVLRVLAALQSDELCPCNWQPGQLTLGPEPVV
jgi:peroxiredoxin (alkyl hydroperoxide reductase subunit C)